MVARAELTHFRADLPSFLFGPGIVGVVFCVLEVLACVACFIAIRSGEGYHSKRSTVDPTSNEMRRTYIVSKYSCRPGSSISAPPLTPFYRFSEGWGLKYVVSIVGGGMFVAVGR